MQKIVTSHYMKHGVISLISLHLRYSLSLSISQMINSIEVST